MQEVFEGADGQFAGADHSFIADFDRSTDFCQNPDLMAIVSHTIAMRDLADELSTTCCF